jgi:hypothetical protein
VRSLSGSSALAPARAPTSEGVAVMLPVLDTLAVPLGVCEPVIETEAVTLELCSRAKDANDRQTRITCGRGANQTLPCPVKGRLPAPPASRCQSW